MIWIGGDGGRDCYVLQTHRLCCKWFGPLHARDCNGFPRSCFCCVGHLQVSASCTSCSRGACFRKTAGARKPRRVATCRLNSDRFRWAKHEILVKDRQSSVDCCIVRHVTKIFSFLDGFVPPAPTRASCLGIRNFSPGDFAMMLSREAGSVPMLPFCKSREHTSPSQEPATERVCSLRICKHICMPKHTRMVSLSSGKNGCPLIWATLKHRSSTSPALQQS